MCRARCCARSDARCCRGCGRLRGLTLRKPCSGFWLYVFFVLNTCTFLTGVGFLLALSVDNRSANIKAFNAAVASWSQSSAAAFSNLNVTIRGDRTLALPASTSVDSYPDVDGLSLPVPVNMRYAATGAASAPISARAFNSGAQTTLTTSINGTTSTSTVTLFSTTTSTSNGRTTTKNHRLSALCFTVDAAQLVTGGCAPDDGYVAATKTECGSECAGSVAFNIPITVRSDADPYVKALRMTGGKLFFGVSQVVKVVVGSVLAGVALLFHAFACARLRRSPPPEREGIGGFESPVAVYGDSGVVSHVYPAEQQPRGPFAPGMAYAAYGPPQGAAPMTAYARGEPPAPSAGAGTFYPPPPSIPHAALETAAPVKWV